MFPASSYDPETLAMLGSAFEEAWKARASDGWAETA